MDKMVNPGNLYCRIDVYKYKTGKNAEVLYLLDSRVLAQALLTDAKLSWYVPTDSDYDNQKLKTESSKLITRLYVYVYENNNIYKAIFVDSFSTEVAEYTVKDTAKTWKEMNDEEIEQQKKALLRKTLAKTVSELF